jgi:hypothetical protein
MQPNKTKLALQIGAVVLGAICASNSFADTFTATINTVDDVNIAPRAGYVLDFGPNLFVDAGSSCELQVSAQAAGNQPGGDLMNYAITLDNAADPDASFGSLDGTGLGCTTTATPAAGGTSAGIWDISGAAGTQVSLLITNIVQTPADFTFVPSGCYVNYSNTDAANGDSCLALAANSVETANFAASTAEDDALPGAGAGTSTPGQFSIALGGLLTVGVADLDPSRTYDLSFQIDVTY